MPHMLCRGAWTYSRFKLPRSLVERDDWKLRGCQSFGQQSYELLLVQFADVYLACL